MLLGLLIIKGKELLVGLRERAEALALLDPLTELPNRRAMLDWLSAETERDSPTGLMLVDLDGFKDVNTAHGYPAGDAVLRETAARLRRCVRTDDVVARLGGDEFAVLAPDATRETMRLLAERTLCSLRDLSHEDVSLTASVGWVIYPDDAESVDELIAAADFCLRGAKLTGKDRALSALDWAPDESRGIVRRVRRLRVLHDSFEDDPALDAAVSRALMLRVAAGELPETLRIAQPGTTVAFAKRDAVADGYEEAVRAGPRPGLRRHAAARRAAARRYSTTARWRSATPCPTTSRARASTTASSAPRTRLARALRRLGVDARVGEVPGEYCPGRYSVNARGAVKLAGIGQRSWRRRIAHRHGAGGEGEERINDVLGRSTPRSASTGSPPVSGSVRAEAPAPTWDAVRDAIVTEYAREYELVEGELDAETLALARDLAAEHRVG